MKSIAIDSNLFPGSFYECRSSHGKTLNNSDSFSKEEVNSSQHFKTLRGI